MARDVTYTEDQLRKAIAASRSWRGVLRALGLRGASSQSAQVRAAALGIDTSHFTGQRRWSYDELRDAVASSSTWAEAAHTLGSASPGDVKRHALRAGLDVSHIGRRTDCASLAADFQHRPETWRNAAEHWAAAWFYSVGGTAAMVHGQELYDLLVTIPGERTPQKVQVKTSGRRDSNGRWNFGLQTRGAAEGAVYLPYGPDEVDYFFLVAASGEAWLVPVAKVLGNRNCHPGPEFDRFKVNSGPAWVSPAVE